MTTANFNRQRLRPTNPRKADTDIVTGDDSPVT